MLLASRVSSETQSYWPGKYHFNRYRPMFQSLIHQPVSRVTSPVGSDAISTGEGSGSLPAVPTRKSYLILRNSKGQCIDASINPPSSLVDMMKTTRRCNPFHMLGECNYKDCPFLQDVRLDEKGIEARRVISRYKPCPSKFKCKGENCLLGH